jgi:hypothetical protein
VAAWFLVVDTLAGRPFFTPAMLGGAVFWGLRDPALVDISFATVVGYTMIHVLAFVLAGIVAAFLVYEAELFPHALFLVAVCFAAFEFGFYIIVAIAAHPLLGALAWWAVAIGNTIAALGMGYYLWRMHPRLREGLKAYQLGDERLESRVDHQPTH